MLQNRYRRIAVQRLEELQENRVACGARQVRVQPDHIAHVLERVVEPDLPLVTELGIYAQQERRDQNQYEQTVLRDQRADPRGVERGSQEREPAAGSRIGRGAVA